uniref:Odorant-binding protein 27 n=1 Tax=Pyrrhalta aenescens TaxID=281545 RepID=A0A1J0KKM5_9CUCU|nr:odorant-binding protein 27 [Pyrrhalta aenescens]
MKLELLIFTFCFISVKLQNPSGLAEIMAAHRICTSRTGISPALATGIISGRFPNDPILKQHLLCVNQQLGVQDQSGRIQTNRVSQLATNLSNSPSADISAIVSRCAVQKSTPQDTAFDLVKCMWQARRSGRLQ